MAVKSRHVEGFLKDGNKVKAHVQFKGRAIMFKERGELICIASCQVWPAGSIAQVRRKADDDHVHPKTQKAKKKERDAEDQ
jgi:translation initiation factor IF-3